MRNNAMAPGKSFCDANSSPSTVRRANCETPRVSRELGATLVGIPLAGTPLGGAPLAGPTLGGGVEFDEENATGVRRGGGNDDVLGGYIDALGGGNDAPGGASN